MRELELFFSELQDFAGDADPQAQTESKELGVQYAKLKAVYHKTTKDQLRTSDMNTLMGQPEVESVLGTVKTLAAPNAAGLYEQLKPYIDSKEKQKKTMSNSANKSTTGTPTDEEKSEATMEFWPLVKVVKIYTKATVLSTGAVLVDLVS